MSPTDAPSAAPSTALADLLIDRWAAGAWRPRLPAAAVRWSWFRDASQQALGRAASALGIELVVSLPVLSAAFTDWVALLEREARFEALDRADHARYACGMLLRNLMTAHPLDCRPGRVAVPATGPATAAVPPELLHDPGLALKLRLCLTLLDGWLRGLGHDPLVLHAPSTTPSFIASCFENLREDPNQAPAFVDALTGAEPNWRFPTLAHERPVVRRALEAGRDR